MQSVYIINILVKEIRNYSSTSGTFRSRHIPYLRKKGPMGGAPYIGPRLGDGPIFEVSVSQLDVKERPGKYP